jgi:hypothetical protein
VRVVSSVDEAVRAGVAMIVLFGLCGFALTRLLLPDRLRATELLWIAPVGGCVAAISLAVLGYAAVPFHVSLAIVVAAGAGSSVLAVRRSGLPRRPSLRAVGWPAYIAVLLTAVALIPYFRGGYASVIGIGSDAHLAVGTAQFLQHNYPTSTNIYEPVDRVPLVWRSKPPIYYGLGAVSSLAGLEPYQTIAPVAALLLAMAAIGLFFIVTYLLGAGWAAATLAMTLAGLDRMALHTGMHPYFNQTWGYFAFPFAIVLSWFVAQRPTRGGITLLLLFLAIGAFAYPLALPLPLIVLAATIWSVRRERGTPPVDWRALGRRIVPRKRALLWVLPLMALLSIPVGGVVEKMATAAKVVLNPTASLASWGGDLFEFVPLHQFFSIGWDWLAIPTLPIVFVCALWALRDSPVSVRWGLGAIGIFGMATALYFRERNYGWYFHFKTLAYVGPLIVAIAAVGMTRLRVVGPIVLFAFLISAGQSARSELGVTPYQLSAEAIQLRGWAKQLPYDASVRLDVEPVTQLWPAYMMSRQRLCAVHPLLGTQYPHVRTSIKADYSLVGKLRRHRPPDAVGPAVFENKLYALYHLSPKTPGKENCSRAMIQTVKKIAGD